VGAGHAFAAIPDDLAERYLGTEWLTRDDAGRGASIDRWLARAVARGVERARG
jgi:hypothetical protein